ncbi:MAG TPA: hypothetical protein VGC41_26955, partial [Kofleriaceae bacterium]
RELAASAPPFAANVPVVVITDDSATMLASSVAILRQHPWIQFSLSSSAFTSPHIRNQLEGFLDRVFDREPPLISETGFGRIALLANAARREERFARMREFFVNNGLSQRTIEAAIDVTEELVMNALYDAPFEAGFFSAAVPRTQLVELPRDRACEISYGLHDGELFVRLRDTFGALTRRRVIDVLSRCVASEVSLDESRGGAGLGLWRIFSTASSIAITVKPRCLTDIMVTISTQRGRAAKPLRAISLFMTATDERATVARAPALFGDLDHSFAMTASI